MKDICVARTKWSDDLYHGEDLADIAHRHGFNMFDLEVVEYVNPTDFELRKLPDELQQTVSGMAYERGHSAGEDEVLAILRGLVADLAPACAKLVARLPNERR